jgi:hypothetical protein
VVLAEAIGRDSKLELFRRSVDAVSVFEDGSLVAERQFGFRFVVAGNSWRYLGLWITRLIAALSVL